MWRRERLLVGVSLAAFAGVALVLSSVLWILWRDSLATEEALVGGLAQSLGERAEQVIFDTRDLLASLDQLTGPRCTRAHLQTMEEEAARRPYLRAIGHWRAAERQCGVGFLQTHALKPPRADRIYESGLIAWWPGPHTEVGGVPLFLLRFGDHDAAIDPRMLLEVGPRERRQVALWVEHLPLASQPADAVLPPPDAMSVGVSVDRARGLVLSRFSREALLPIDVVATEPLRSFWGRHAPTLTAGTSAGLMLAGAWLGVVIRFSRRRLSLAAELRDAIAHERIAVHYQPIVDLATGRCVGAEALARWTRGNGESVPPDVFFPIAEQEGFATAVTLSICDAVTRDLADLLVHAPGFSISVNLTAADLREEAFASRLGERLTAANLANGAIKLEITERALVQGDTARRTIRKLRQRGHQVAVDDFGTGYSSLSYLQSFELDVLKIDKVFVEAIDTPATTPPVITHVIEIARCMDLQVIAEGVETEAQRRWLLAHGVDLGQGYLFGAPLAPRAFRDWLRETRAA